MYTTTRFGKLMEMSLLIFGGLIRQEDLPGGEGRVDVDGEEDDIVL